MNFLEKKLNSKTLYNGKVVRLDVDEIELPNGKKSFRECVRHSGGACVLLVEDGKVLLVNQYRYAYSQPIYEIPAGKLNKGEDPCLAAARELEEETGYKAKLSHLIDLYPTPGYSDEVIYIYFAESFVKTNQKLDDGEFLDYCFIELDKVLKMIEDGEIKDAKTIVAIYKYMLTKVNGSRR